MIRKSDLKARKCFCEEYTNLLNYMNLRYEKVIKYTKDKDRILAMERLIDLVIELEEKGSYDKD